MPPSPPPPSPPPPSPPPSPPSPPPPSLPPSVLSASLVALYTATSLGENGWARSDNWLDGEPCINRWYGITCCPSDYAYVGENCVSADGLRTVDAVRLRDDLADGGERAAWDVCHSGSYTGTSADLALCVVVKISLPYNNV
jgi:hypothetical protein